VRLATKYLRFVVIAVVVTLLVSAVLVATHRPDKDAYLQYVATYGDYNNLEVQPVSDRDLLAGGARACDWLRDRPMALWRAERKWTVNSLYTEYERSLPKADAPLPKSFLPGAFTYLCPLSTYMHKPHQLHHRTTSD
jgi:hypothetical protein